MSQEKSTAAEHCDETVEDLEGADDPGETEDELRRSSRESRKTEKMAVYIQAEFEKREGKFSSAYHDWQLNVKKLRNILRTDCDHSELVVISEKVKILENAVVEHFEELRTKGTIPPLIMRRVDACVAITNDIDRIVNERLCEMEEFDSKRELARLKMLRNNEYAKSIFSIWETESTNSSKSILSERVADAAAALAEKQAKFELLQEEEDQRTKLAEIEREIKRFEARKEIRLAQARLNAYAQVLNGDSDEKVSHEPIPTVEVDGELLTEGDENLVKNDLCICESARAANEECRGKL